MVSPKYVEYSWTRDDDWDPHTVRGILMHRVISLFVYLWDVYICKLFYIYIVFLYSVVLDSVGQLHQSAIGIFIPALSWTSLPGSPSPPSSHHRAPRWALCAIEQVPLATYFTHCGEYMSRLFSQSGPFSFSRCVHRSNVYICENIVLTYIYGI